MPYDSSRDRNPKGAAIVPQQARRAAAVSPNDTQDLPVYAKRLYVGGAGNLVVLLVDDRDQDPVTFTNHPVGYTEFQVRRVFTTSTATGLVALYD